DPAQRQPGELRALLGHKSPMLALIHSPDEPADLVKEVAVLLPELERTSLFSTMLQRTAFAQRQAAQLMVDLYAHSPPHSLDWNESLERLETAAHQHIAGDDKDVQAAAKLFEQIRRGSRTDWRLLFEILDRHRTQYDEWDRITVAGHIITMNRDNMRVLIPRAPRCADSTANAARQGWLDCQSHTRAEC